MINNCYSFKELKEKFNWTTDEGNIQAQIRYARKRGVNIEVAFKQGPTYFKIIDEEKSMSMFNEVWVSYPKDPYFDITKTGKVRNAITLQMLGSVNPDGYVTVRNTKIDKTYRVHRMVMETFFPIDNADEMLVDHIDGNRSHNSIDNLRWVSPQENCAYKNENWSKISKNFDKMLQKYGYDGLNNLFIAILNEDNVAEKEF